MFLGEGLLDERRESAKEDRFTLLRNPELRRDLFEGVQKLIEIVAREQVDTLVFLDKGARPIFWLFKEVWKETDLGPLPEIHFVNIGLARELHLGALNDEELAKKKQGDPSSDLSSLPFDFEGRRVLIVDDICSTGRTLDKAKKLFRNAFPRAQAIGTHAIFDSSQYIELPWNSIPGASGTVEVDAGILAKPLTQENLQKIQNKLFGKWRDVLTRDGWHPEALLEVTSDVEKTKRDFLQTYPDHPLVVKFRDVFDRGPDSSLGVREQEDALLNWARFLIDAGTFVANQGCDDHGFLRLMEVALGKDRRHSGFSFLIDAARYMDVNHIQAQAKQMREEMRLLAKEKVDTV